MTGWRSVLDLDYLADLGAAVDALGESEAEHEPVMVESRVIVLAGISDGDSLGDAYWTTHTETYWTARLGMDIERALRAPRRGGCAERDPRDARRYKEQARYRKRRHRFEVLPPMRQLNIKRRDRS